MTLHQTFASRNIQGYDWYSTHAVTEHPAAKLDYAVADSRCGATQYPSLADRWNINPGNFHVAKVRQLSEITRIIRATVDAWSTVDNFIREVERKDEPTSYSDENAKHLPMKRRYLDTKVLVLPASARKRRAYNAEDHQVWKL